MCFFGGTLHLVVGENVTLECAPSGVWEGFVCLTLLLCHRQGVTCGEGGPRMLWARGGEGGLAVAVLFSCGNVLVDAFPPLLSLLSLSPCVCLSPSVSHPLRHTATPPPALHRPSSSSSSSQLGAWSWRGCRTVLVDPFRTKCLCDRISTFAILAQLSAEMVSDAKGSTRNCQRNEPAGDAEEEEEEERAGGRQAGKENCPARDISV